MKDTTKVILGIIGFFLAFVGSCEGVKYVKKINTEKIEIAAPDTLSIVFDTIPHGNDLTFLSAPTPVPVIETVVVEKIKEVFRAPKGYKLVPDHYIASDPDEIASRTMPTPVLIAPVLENDSIARTHPYFTNGSDTTTNFYTDQIEDSTIVFSYAATTTGTLDGIDIAYKLKGAKTIRETVTVEKIKHVPTDLTEFFLGGGLNTRTDGGAGFSIGAALLTKKHVLTSYDYDLVNKAHQISFKYRIVGK